MKTLFGIGLIILGLVSLFRYPYSGYTSLPEMIGILLGFGIIILPGILLIRSDNKNKSNTHEK
jgi:uncharacterized membrane protein HdeD (DUF308 family)